MHIIALIEVGGRWGKTTKYLGAESFQLGGCHANQLHSLLVVGDGACQVGHLNKCKQIYLATTRDYEIDLGFLQKERYTDAS